MPPKRKASAISVSGTTGAEDETSSSSSSASTASKRKPNGIKGVTVAQKSNDPLRDDIIQTLKSSGIKGEVESRVVFAHTGIYIGDSLFGWVGQGTSFSIRCNNAAQKKICASFGCPVMEYVGHKVGNYYLVPESLQKNKSKLRSLAEQVIAAGPATNPKIKAAARRGKESAVAIVQEKEDEEKKKKSLTKVAKSKN